MSSWPSYEGFCHCRAVGFDYRSAIAPELWPIRACQCTFCRSHGALSTSDSGGALRFVAHVPDAFNRYQFGRRTADDRVPASGVRAVSPDSVGLVLS